MNGRIGGTDNECLHSFHDSRRLTRSTPDSSGRRPRCLPERLDQTIFQILSGIFNLTWKQRILPIPRGPQPLVSLLWSREHKLTAALV